MGDNGGIYAKVRESYRNKAREKREEAERRRERLEAEIPGLAEVDAALRETSLNIIKEAMKGADGLDGRIEQLRVNNAELQETQRTLLVGAGYSADELEPKYDCEKCKDTGIYCDRLCDCMKRAMTEAGTELSGIAKLIKKQSFDNFSLEYYTGEDRTRMEENLKSIRALSEKMSASSPFYMLFMGGTGLGKTHLSSAVAGDVLSRGFDVIYDSAQNIIRAFEAERYREEDRTKKYFSCDLLIIDDLGSEQNTQFSVASFYNLLNTRLIDEKSILISTNLGIKEIETRYNDRIASRLMGEFGVFLFRGRDIRSQKLTNI